MIIKTSKLTAVSVAFAVWLTYSVPAHAAPYRKAERNFPASVFQGEDHDDDVLSGGALAVLLLLVGGAVVLFSGRAPGKDGISCKRLSDEMTVTTNSTDQTGKQRRSEWKAKLDGKSGTIKLIRSGGSTNGQWLEKPTGNTIP